MKLKGGFGTNLHVEFWHLLPITCGGVFTIPEYLNNLPGCIQKGGFFKTISLNSSRAVDGRYSFCKIFFFFF